ncbi:serine O-acetyltransferase [Nonomuraea rubra]|uniref:serine O-acetyltransferase n=1 Tax=Nonomuraea rubra TaxID=46180 RepID=UPI003615D587
MNFDDGVHAAVEETAAEILGPWLPQVRAVTRRAPWDTVLAEPVELAVGDLLELATQDPAAGGSWELVLRTYRAYRAVLVYRLAHALLEHGGREGPAETLARRLSEQAKVETGVELHPAARIGPRFMVDHGYGTVVGRPRSSAATATCCRAWCWAPSRSTTIRRASGTRRWATAWASGRSPASWGRS